MKPRAGSLMVVLFVVVVLLALPRAAAAQGDLERARKLYNAGQFDESIAAATTAKVKPSAAVAATLIIARSRLERFRTRGDAEDLAAARTALVSLNPHTLAPQEAIEWQIGVGTALFLENQLAPAAETFSAVLPSARTRLPADEFDKVLEWWAAAMSRLAETLTGDARKRTYEKLHADARLALERDPLSGPAAYWTMAALRGAGDFDAAWGAAVAGWIRAGASPAGQRLRADLDNFVMQTLIPERAQARTGQRLDARTTMAEIAALTDEWRALTTRWQLPT
jgi:hypothetical protein